MSSPAYRGFLRAASTLTIMTYPKRLWIASSRPALDQSPHESSSWHFATADSECAVATGTSVHSRRTRSERPAHPRALAPAPPPSALRQRLRAEPRPNLARVSKDTQCCCRASVCLWTLGRAERPTAAVEGLGWRLRAVERIRVETLVDVEPVDCAARIPDRFGAGPHHIDLFVARSEQRDIVADYSHG